MIIKLVLTRSWAEPFPWIILFNPHNSPNEVDVFIIFIYQMTKQAQKK